MGSAHSFRDADSYEDQGARDYRLDQCRGDAGRWGQGEVVDHSVRFWHHRKLKDLVGLVRRVCAEVSSKYPVGLDKYLVEVLKRNVCYVPDFTGNEAIMARRFTAN